MFGNPIDDWEEKSHALDDLPPPGGTDAANATYRKLAAEVARLTTDLAAARALLAKATELNKRLQAEIDSNYAEHLQRRRLEENNPYAGWNP